MQFLLPMRDIRETIHMLQPYENQFNKLSVSTFYSSLYLTDHFIEKLTVIYNCVYEYFKWKSELHIVGDETHEVIRNMLNVAGSIEESNKNPSSFTNVDPRSMLHLKDLDERVIPKLTDLWFSLYCRSGDNFHDMPITIYRMYLSRMLWCLTTLLFQACKVFNLECPIKKFVFISTEIIPAFVEDDEVIPEFTLHDEVVAFSPEEIEAQKQREAEEARLAAEERKAEAAKEALRDHIETVNKAYETHIKLNTFSKFAFNKTPFKYLDSMDLETCRHCESLYKLLMAMSESVRYMPGEEATDFNRIMGSFMEIENDILTYRQRFTIYLHSYGLEVHDIFNAIQFFDNSNGTFKAQFVDTKEFIEEKTPNYDGNRSIHLFVQ